MICDSMHMGEWVSEGTRRCAPDDAGVTVHSGWRRPPCNGEALQQADLDSKCAVADFERQGNTIRLSSAEALQVWLLGDKTAPGAIFTRPFIT